jgi:hypothetical protein
VREREGGRERERASAPSVSQQNSILTAREQYKPCC